MGPQFNKKPCIVGISIGCIPKQGLRMSLDNPIYTRCTWAGGTEGQFVVKRKFIRELHNTSSKFNIRVKIL
jgi:hypothetical protein